MNKPRRAIRHPGEGPNRHKARVGRRLRLLSERMRDVAMELELVGLPCKGGQLRGAAVIAANWAGQLSAPQGTP